MSPLRHARLYGALLPALFVLIACSPPPAHDVILRGSTVYDGTGSETYVADIAIDNDSIKAIGDLDDARGCLEIDAEGLAVAPGFINMLSWASFNSDEASLADGEHTGAAPGRVVRGPGWAARGAYE